MLHETGLRGASLEAVGTGACRFRQALTVGVTTLRGWGGGPQGIGLLTTAGRLAPLKCQLTQRGHFSYLLLVSAKTSSTS